LISDAFASKGTETETHYNVGIPDGSRINVNGAAASLSGHPFGAYWRDD
jgi:hypothetical protein